MSLALIHQFFLRGSIRERSRIFRAFVLVMVSGAILALSLTATPVALGASDPITGPATFDAGVTEAESIATRSNLPQHASGIFGTLANIVLLLLSLVSILAAAAIVWGAIMYIASFGNEARAALAKRIILYAIVGFILASAVFAIMATVSRLVGGTP